MSSAIIQQIPLGPMANFAYLIGDGAEKVCAAVDPGWNAQEIIRAAEGRGWAIAKILLTHAHFDHANALEALAKLTGAEIYVHRADAGDLPKGLSVHPTEEGTAIAVGGESVTCLHTPGHTPGSQCFLTGTAIITGDTLFVDNCGRVDLPESNPSEMLSSLSRLAALDAATVVYPGHDYGPTPTSTIGEQRMSNPYMNARSEAVLM